MILLRKPESRETHYRGLRIYAAGDVHRGCMKIVEGLGLPKGAHVLDLGAGEGAFSQRLVDNGFRVTAVDIAPERFRAACPVRALDLNGDFHVHLDEKPDAITAIELVEHLQSPRHFIRECLSLLGTGGTLLFTSPNLESWVSRIRFLRSGRPA